MDFINKFDEKNIFVIPQTKLFTNYISLTNRISSYEIINEVQIIKKNINSFALLCLKYPSFAYAKKPDKIDENCLKNYEGYKQVNEVDFNDFFIRHLEIIK